MKAIAVVMLSMLMFSELSAQQWRLKISSSDKALILQGRR